MTMEYRLLEEEVLLKNDYNIFMGFVYIVDGVLMRSPASGKVKDWKDICGVKEIRKCNLFGHEGAKIGDKVR